MITTLQPQTYHTPQLLIPHSIGLAYSGVGGAAGESTRCSPPPGTPHGGGPRLGSAPPLAHHPPTPPPHSTPAPRVRPAARPPPRWPPPRPPVRHHDMRPPGLPRRPNKPPQHNQPPSTTPPGAPPRGPGAPTNARVVLLLVGFVWINQGGVQGGQAGTFVMALPAMDSGPVRALFLADFDGDGDLDALLGERRWATIWWNDGLALFTKSRQRFFYTKRHGLAVGDFNGDVRMDIFAAAYDDKYRVWFNQGNGRFNSTP